MIPEETATTLCTNNSRDDKTCKLVGSTHYILLSTNTRTTHCAAFVGILPIAPS